MTESHLHALEQTWTWKDFLLQGPVFKPEILDGAKASGLIKNWTWKQLLRKSFQVQVCSRAGRER